MLKLRNSISKSPKGNPTLSDPLRPHSDPWKTCSHTPGPVSRRGELSVSSCAENFCFQKPPKTHIGVPAPYFCRWVATQVRGGESNIPGGSWRISVPLLPSCGEMPGVSGRFEALGAGLGQVGAGRASAFGSITTGRGSGRTRRLLRRMRTLCWLLLPLVSECPRGNRWSGGTAHLAPDTARHSWMALQLPRCSRGGGKSAEAG